MFNKLIKLFIMELIRRSPFESSMYFVVHEKGISQAVLDAAYAGLKATLVARQVKKRDLDSVTKDALEEYINGAITVYQLVSLQNAIKTTGRTDYLQFLEQRNWTEERCAMWSKVLEQFTLPSEVAELMRQLYSPIILADGSIFCAVPENFDSYSPREFMFGEYQYNLIARQFTTKLTPTTRTNLLDVYPLIYQHSVDKGKQVSKTKVDAALKRYRDGYSSSVPGLDSQFQSIIESYNKTHSTKITRDNVAKLLDYSMFSKLADFTFDGGSGRNNEPLLFPEGYELMFFSGAVFGMLSKMTEYLQTSVRALLTLRPGYSEGFKPSDIIGTFSMLDKVRTPVAMKSQLAEYVCEVISEQDIMDWWTSAFMDVTVQKGGKL